MARVFSQIAISLFFIALIAGCGTNQPLETVKEVNLKKYMGTWYELGRFPNRFEKDLVCVTANYQLNDDGSIKVTNRGKDTTDGEWNESVGVAKVPDTTKPGQIKVAFFKPFYGDYYIMALDDNYQYALVGSPNRDYLWILCREKTLDQKTYNELLEVAKSRGFDIKKFVRTGQGCGVGD